MKMENYDYDFGAKIDLMLSDVEFEWGEGFYSLDTADKDTE
jgi:hypothetical protein